MQEPVSGLIGPAQAAMVACVKFAENTAGSHGYHAALGSGCILQTRGLSSFFFARDFVRLLQIHLT